MTQPRIKLSNSMLDLMISVMVFEANMMEYPRKWWTNTITTQSRLVTQRCFNFTFRSLGRNVLIFFNRMQVKVLRSQGQAASRSSWLICRLAKKIWLFLLELTEDPTEILRIGSGFWLKFYQVEQLYIYILFFIF